MAIEGQEIYCHACDGYVRFKLDMSLDGNHVLQCPNCGHEHCRVIKNGIITSDRWDSRNGATYKVPMAYVTYTSSASTANYFWITSSGGTGSSG